MSPDGGVTATSEFEPGEAVADHDRQLDALASLLSDGNLHAVLEPDDIQTDNSVQGASPSSGGRRFAR